MVHLCVSISDDGPRLESVLRGSPRQAQDCETRGAVDMAALRPRPRSRLASSRQDRGSCSSTASCPVFSGSYSDQEDDPPPRRQSSPIRRSSLSTLSKSTADSSNSSGSSLQRSQPSLPTALGSLPNLKGSLTGFQASIAKLKGSMLGLKRRSLGSLESPGLKPKEGSSSSSLHSGSLSSSEDDGSWDTNSWSSGVTCLLRHPAGQQTNEGLQVHPGLSGKGTADQTSIAAVSEPEVIYQNLIFSQPADKNKGITASQSTSLHSKNKGMYSSSESTNILTTSTPLRNYRAEDKIRFSQFLNEVTGRVLKFNRSHPQQSTTLRHRYPSPPPSTPPPPPSPETTTQPPVMGMWRSPTTANLKIIHESYSRDLASSIHRWSQSLPSCRVLEPGDVLRKVKGESYLYPEREVALCTKIQTQPSTGRLYLETDIDRVRRLDELADTGALGKERVQERVAGKCTASEKERERKKEIVKGTEGGADRGKEMEAHPQRDRGKERGVDKTRDGPWEREKSRERGREKQKRVVRDSHDPSPSPQTDSNGRRRQRPDWPEGFPSMSYRSTSLPRSAFNRESDGEIQHGTSSVHDHKDELRKRLSYTTHKLEMVEMEFDSTRQYLETELRRAQEELEKFTDKLRRIQSSYAALQRINQDLEEKMNRTSQHHDDEKRALSREIIALNNHLMEAKITVDKLREDNDLYRKDCNLAAQLLQCSKSHRRAHKMSELPLDFQERVSSHLEKLNHGGGSTTGLRHSTYSDSVPTSIIAKVIEKPEPGSGCQVTRSPSPQTQDEDFLSAMSSTDQLNRRVAYKTSDLYCSDTALYCPERWQDTERRQSVDLNGPRLLQLHGQNSVDSNPEEEAFHSGGFSHHEAPSSFHLPEEFGAGSLPASSSYSSFSIASDDDDNKVGDGGGGGRTASSTLSSSHQVLYMDWRDGSSGDYERKSASSYEKDSTHFHKSQSIQHMAPSRSPQRGVSPAYTRTASCFSEPYHSSSPRLTSSSLSAGPASASARARGGAGGRVESAGGGDHMSEEELSSRWRQLSVEDVNTFSSSYRDLTGRASPYSFSECHFAVGPSSKAKVGPLYSSFKEGDDVFHSLALDQCFAVASPSPSRSPTTSSKHPGLEHHKQEKLPALCRAQEDSQDSECSLFLSGSSKEKENGGGRATVAAGVAGANEDYVNLRADSSPDSLHLSSLEASSLQHYPCPRPSSRPRPSSSSALSMGPALPKKTSPRYQKFGSTGLTRKDSLTKAQLYGTLLN